MVKLGIESILVLMLCVFGIALLVYALSPALIGETEAIAQTLALLMGMIVIMGILIFILVKGK